MQGLYKNERHEGFYYCMLNPAYSANAQGVIIESFTGVVLPQTLQKGYFYAKNLGVHRLVCSAFHVKPQNPNFNMVNHIDLNTQNNSPSNLEWTDNAGNVTHAYGNGVNENATVVLVKDLLTGEVLRFNSQADCASFFKASKASISLWLTACAGGAVRASKYCFIREGDDWPESDLSQIGKFVVGHQRQVAAFSTVDSKVIIFGSVKQAAEYFNVSDVFVSKCCSGQRSSASLNVIFVYVDECTDESKLANAEVIVRERKKRSSYKNPIPSKPVFTKDLVTGEVKEWASARELSDYYNVDKSTISKTASINGRFRNLLISYMNPKLAS